MKKLFLLLSILVYLFTTGYAQVVVDSIVFFKTNAGCPKWSPITNSQIAYHTLEIDNNYDIHIMHDDGSNDICITCNHPNLPNRHMGNHSYHPSGNMLSFIAEKSNYYLDSLLGGLAKPGIGWNCDVYMISLVTGNAYQITDLPTKMGPFDTTPVTGVLGPHFSPDGTKFTWGERIDTCGTYDWGEYVIRIADLEIVNDTPYVTNIQTLQPANCRYLETNSFSSNSQKLYFCGNIYPNQTEYGIDIFSYDLITTQIDTMFHTQDYFDECAHISPSDNKIAYLSTEGYPNDTTSTSWWSWAKGEFWIMDANGTNRYRLTNFNVAGYPEYTGKRIIPAMIDWNLNETILLAGLAEQTFPAIPTVLKDQIYKIYISGTSSMIENNKLSDDIIVFPNPSVDGCFNISTIDATLTIQSFEVYDAKGNLAFSGSDNTSFKINENGIYLIVIKTDKGQILKKIVKL